jgi:membrane protein YdbS with pleckstrin-like domain
MSARVEQTAQLVYRGIWRVLAEWFKVPQEPPTLPTRPGEHLERFKPSPGLLRYLKLFFWIALAAVDLICLVLWIASFAASPVVGAALTPVIIILLVLPEVIAYLAIHLRYDSTWYVLSDRSVRIRWGIWTITETTITFENVQDVKVEQGPVQRYFGISDIVIQTAGGGGAAGPHGTTTTPMHVGRLEGVDDAQRIRDLIMNRVRRSRSAGLGDEHHAGAAAPKPPSAMWTPAHIDLLREIRDGLRSLPSTSGNGG